MKPLIIFEGPDCVGKTTLAKATARELGAVYIHATATKTLCQAMQDYHRSLLDNAITNLREMDLPVVIDRHWLSEICYGSVLRPGNNNGYMPASHEARITEQCGIYVFCMGDFETAAARHEREKDMDHPYDFNTYSRIFAQFEIMLEDFRRSNRYDYLVYTIEEYGERTKDFIGIIKARHNELLSRR